MKVSDSHLSKLIKHNVPRLISHIEAKGGLTQEDWYWLKSQEVEDVVGRADNWLFFPKTEDDFKHGLSVIVRIIAILSFVPGGIYLMGEEWKGNG